MKRYRVLRLTFDTRAVLLSIARDNAAAGQTLATATHGIVTGLVQEYGSMATQQKVNNFVEFGQLPFSILAFHNKFLLQVRDAFVVGAYYCAMTGACSLGERILNHLLLRLRGYYKGSEVYKKIYRKDSFDDWNLAIDALSEWGVLLPEVASDYRQFKRLRDRAVHFHPDVDSQDRGLALDASKMLCHVIERQFGGFGNQPWFIDGANDPCYIRKTWENHPFIKEIYIPNCVLVGPRNRLATRGYGFVVENDPPAGGPFSDEEFAAEVNLGPL